jgi:hypothetical protein
MSSPNQAYGQIESEALPMIASLFMQHFGNTNDPRAQQFAQMDPNAVTPEALAQMHQYAAQNHPGILGEVMQNPQVSSALGGFAENEMRNLLGGHGL